MENKEYDFISDIMPANAVSLSPSSSQEICSLYSMFSKLDIIYEVFLLNFIYLNIEIYVSFIMKYTFSTVNSYGNTSSIFFREC